MIDDKKYPSNSLLGKSSLDQSPPKQEEEIKKTIKGTAHVKKKSVGRKFLDVFLSADIGSVLDHVIYDVVIPKFKETVLSAVSVALNGTPYRPSGSKTSDGVHTDYTSFSKKDRVEISPTIRTLGTDVYFQSGEDAQDALNDLRDRIRTDGYVSVRTFYGIAGLPCDHTKVAYGWRNLDNAGVVRAEEGYWIRLPRPEYLR